MINVEIGQVSDKALLFDLSTQEIEPSDLALLQFPRLEVTKVVVIADLSAWMMAAAVSEYTNQAAWIGVVDEVAKDDKHCIVIWSVASNYKRGQIVPLNELGLENI